MSQLPLTTEQRHELISQCLELIREGKSFPEASAQLGINPRTLNSWLLSTIPDKYREAQRNGVVSKMIDLAETMETAPSHLLVARTRESLKFWQWVAERRLPEFAPKQEISGPGGGPIQLDGLERARRVSFLRSLDEREPIDVTPITLPTT